MVELPIGEQHQTVLAGLQMVDVLLAGVLALRERLQNVGAWKRGYSN